MIYSTTGSSTNATEYGIIMAAPQLLPNVFTIDDGTTRFSLVTPNIMISHSGLSSDGRILVAAAQKLAIQHEYTFDESIDIHILLEELSLLYQEYTMKVAARPFGATLIVAYVPMSVHNHPNQPALYRIDPSGNVESLEQYSIINGKNLMKTDLLSNLKTTSNQSRQGNITFDECRSKVVESFRTAWQQQQQMHQNSDKNDETTHHPDCTILTASLSRNGTSNEGAFRKESHNF
jgi:20S proteasome alpha/beta subunit